MTEKQIEKATGHRAEMRNGTRLANSRPRRR